jgi:hypothetical protein
VNLYGCLRRNNLDIKNKFTILEQIQIKRKMKKARINRFVQKYNLAGLIESVKWETKNKQLSTAFISDDKSVLGNITMDDFDFEDNQFGVYDTTKLKNMLGVLSDDVDVDVSDMGGRTVSMNFKDKATSINYMLADLSVIPAVPDLKSLPDFDITVNLDDSFIDKFIKSKTALSDESNFTFVCKDGKGQIILGYSNTSTNRINIDVDCTCEGDTNPISFSADFLKAILVANKDCSDATLKISSKGLAHLSFKVDEYSSEYYLVEKKN